MSHRESNLNRLHTLLSNSVKGVASSHDTLPVVCREFRTRTFGLPTMEQKYVFNETKAREIDRDIVNKWRNDWLAGQDKLNRPFSAWLRKLDEPGTAYCLVCNKKLLYRSNGKKSFQSHVVDPEHVAAINSQQHTSTLPTAEPVIADACLSDRVTSAKLRICAFLAEHCLVEMRVRIVLELCLHGEFYLSDHNVAKT